MISFRYHVTTLVAVLLALAAGVALGGGPLSEVGRPDPTPAAATDSATDDRGSDFADALAGQGAARMYGNRLEDVAVSIVSFPGASDATRSALTEQVQAAGGRVAATYAVQPGLVDTGEKTLVDTLGSQLMTQLPDGDLVESLLKRRCGAKDSSRLLPAHGGVLDLIDSLLFSFSAWFLYLVWLT